MCFHYFRMSLLYLLSLLCWERYFNVLDFLTFFKIAESFMVTSFLWGKIRLFTIHMQALHSKESSSVFLFPWFQHLIRSSHRHLFYFCLSSYYLPQGIYKMPGNSAFLAPKVQYIIPSCCTHWDSRMFCLVLKCKLTNIL